MMMGMPADPKEDMARNALSEFMIISPVKTLATEQEIDAGKIEVTVGLGM